MKFFLAIAGMTGLLTVAACCCGIAQNMVRATELAMELEKGKSQLSDYNTACYFALAGINPLAFAYLRKSISAGFSNAKAMQGDEDLVSLHNDPQWGPLLKRVMQNELNAKNNPPDKDRFFNQPVFWDSRFFKTSFQENITEDEKIAGLSKFWSEAKYNFVNFDLAPGVNIDSLYFEYLPRVKNTRSTLEYFKVMAAMVASLKDSHTTMLAAPELQDEVYARPLLRTRLIEDKVVVVQADSSLRAKGIRRGLELVAVNGTPVKAYAAKFVAPYQSCSTPQDLDTRTYEYALLAGSLKETVSLTLASEKGITITRQINRVPSQERSAKMNPPSVEYKILPGDIAYLAINGFETDTASRFFVNNYEAIAKTNGLILDIRNNGGGNTDWTILQYLIDSQVLVHRMYSRQYVPSQRAWAWAQGVWTQTDALDPASKGFYNKPVILLVSARTFSAAEDFAAAFKALHKGRMMGEATGGSTGQPLLIALPGNLAALICTKRDQYVDGTDFVGKGVIPDIVVTPTLGDLRKGIDTQLQAALVEIKKMK